jgi:LytS/YehU family sensor histidine kinase
MPRCSGSISPCSSSRGPAPRAAAGARARRVPRGRAAGEVDSLRLKLNPHFLFNTLNAISAMVVTRRNGDAEQGLERLSAFLRASTECDAAMLSPLEDELHRLDHYVQIEEMRFGERLSVCFDCPGRGGTIPVPALMIQSLIETAIRDGVEPTTRPVTITVRSGINDGWLELASKRTLPDPTPPTPMPPIADIRRRLRAFYGAAAEISVKKDAQGVSTLLRLPAPDATCYRASGGQDAGSSGR